MHAKVISAGLLGVDAYRVEVEVDAGRGVQNLFAVVGLPDAAVKESRDRVRNGFKVPGLKPISINFRHLFLCLD